MEWAGFQSNWKLWYKGRRVHHDWIQSWHRKSIHASGKLCKNLISWNLEALFSIWIGIWHFKHSRVHAVHRDRSERRMRFRNVHECQLWLYKCISTRGEYRFPCGIFTRTHTTRHQDQSGCGNDSPVHGCSAGDKSWTITFCPSS